ncbi:MAG: hypothetical protein ACOY33_05950 [Pseudomonadota bacterium]
MQEPLTCRYERIGNVSVREICRMYEIFSRYYVNAPLETFLADLNRKSGVFLVRRKRDNEVVGFSTVHRFGMKVAGRQCIGVFSGDTLIERAYWGSRALQLAFARYVFRIRMQNPLTPVFWCLISKGYKTYLLLANNYPRYFPHPEGQHEQLAEVVREYCGQLFPGRLDPSRMVLDFGADAQRLNENTAPITDSARQKYPKIAFFEQRNPDWQRGTELPCVGMLGWSDFWQFARQTLVRKMLRRRRDLHPELAASGDDRELNPG